MGSGSSQVAAAVATLAVVYIGIALVFWRFGRRRSRDRSESAPTSPLPTVASRHTDHPSHEPDTRHGLAQITARLEPAARLLGASGLIVWGCSRDGRHLDVLTAHGYGNEFLSRVSPVAVTAPVLTAVAFAERAVRTRRHRGGQPAAIAVPVECTIGPVGVLTIEIDPAAGGDLVTPDAEALARLLASQMAPTVAALAGFPGEPSMPAAPKPLAVRPQTEALSTHTAPEARPAASTSDAPEPAYARLALAASYVPTSTPAAAHASTRTAAPPSSPVEAQTSAPSSALTVTVRVEPPPPDSDSSSRDARSRFIAGFRKRCTSIEELLDEVEQKGELGPVVALKQIVHRLSGLAVIVGLKTVGERATALDRLLESPAAAGDVARIREVFREMQDAYSADLEVVPPLWAAPKGQAVGAHVLLAVDDSVVAARMSDDLRGAAYRVTLTGSGPRALSIARADRPDVILLDVDLGGELDGHGVCRRIKSDPALAEIPVVLVAAHASTVDRMAGFALGADDYLTKPIQTIEMLLRVRWMLTRPTAERQPAPKAGGGLLTSDAFMAVAREVLQQGPAALGVIRVSSRALPDIAALFGDDLRRKDLLGRYSDTQLVVLMPGATAGVAARRVEGVLGIARAAGLDTPCAGIAATGLSAERFLEPLMAEAEAALSAAQVQGIPVSVHGASATATRGSVLVVDDDPDVVHVIDARLKAAGLQTAVAFDGQEALHQVETRAPSVVVLELMLPKRSGFDVLARLRELPDPRPKVIVVSSRSREEDVMRAFELGAEDYLTKPFNPQELLARITRLLR